MNRTISLFPVLFTLAFSVAYAASPATPKIDRVKAPFPDPVKSLPDVFFYENFETISSLGESFQDIGTSDGRFRISATDAFSGRKSMQQTYIPASQMPGDPGDAGWVWRMFGDNPSFISSIPAEQRKPYTTAVARWYHKFEEGFRPAEGGTFPPKMARMRCFTAGNWSGMYTVLFWISGADGHLSIERHTSPAIAHREWPPNHDANFRFSLPQNIGRWIHFELRISLGEGPRSDRIQAWADGVLVCDVAEDDLAGGFNDNTLNGMSWDCYWNGGSPATQSRFYDDLVLSTLPVGPARTETNPVLVKSSFAAADSSARQGGWEVEVAQGVQKPLVVSQVVDGVVTRYEEPEIEYTTVWKGSVEGDSREVKVDGTTGEFMGPRAGQSDIAPNTLHFVRVRQRDAAGNWSDWSAWHCGFATIWAEGTAPEERSLPTGYLAETEAAIVPPDSVPPVIGETSNPKSVSDTVGPYPISASVSDEHLLVVYLMYRKAGDIDYSYVAMTGENGVFTGFLPGQPAGTVVEYYVWALDQRSNSAYAPTDYKSEPFSFKVEAPKSCDFNRDGKINVVDVIFLMLAGMRGAADPAVDYNGDGAYSVTDAIALLLDILAGRCPAMLSQN